MWKFIKDHFTDYKDNWDPKLLFGNIFLGVSLYYILVTHPGDYQTFLALAGTGFALHGWAATPWGGNTPGGV